MPLILHLVNGRYDGIYDDTFFLIIAKVTLVGGPFCYFLSHLFLILFFLSILFLLSFDSFI